MSTEEFSAIVHQWYDPLYRFALSLCRNTEDALDLTQNAFQKLANKSHQLIDRSKVKSWLFSVVHREFIDEYRHTQRFPKTSIDLVAEEPSGMQHAAFISLEAQELLETLEKLDPRFRAPISLFYLEDFSYQEIADTLDIPMGTVMSRLRRAKDQLRRLIEDGTNKTTSRPIPFKKEVQNG